MMEQFMNLKEIELCLGLPGSLETVESPTMSSNERGFSETIDLKLNFQSNKQRPADLNVAGALKEKTFLKDPSKPPAKAQVVGWPSVRNYRKNVMANQKSIETEEAKSGVAFVKVSMHGAPYLRKVDLKNISNE